MNHEDKMREIDILLRRIAIFGPTIAFLFGFASGFVTATLLWRDHEKRIVALEAWELSHDKEDRDRQLRFEEFKTKVKEKLKFS